MADPSGPKNSDYEQGREAGEIAGSIATRLAGHDRHFEAINGSVAKCASELHELRLAVQRLGDQGEARDQTSTAMFTTVRELDLARRTSALANWSLWQRVVAYVVAIGLIVGTMVFLWFLGQR